MVKDGLSNFKLTLVNKKTQNFSTSSFDKSESTSVNFALNQWYYVSVVWDFINKKQYLFVNGNQLLNATITHASLSNGYLPISSERIIQLATDHFKESFFTGSISNFRFYQGLNLNMPAANYCAEKSRFSASTATIGTFTGFSEPNCP